MRAFLTSSAAELVHSQAWYGYAGDAMYLVVVEVIKGKILYRGE